MSLDNLQNSSKQTKRVAVLVHKLPLCMYTYYTPIHMPIPKYIQMCFQILKPKHISIHTYTYLHIHAQPHACIPTNTHKYTNSYMNTHQYIQIYPQELPQIYKHLSIYILTYTHPYTESQMCKHPHKYINTYKYKHIHAYAHTYPNKPAIRAQL